MVGGPWGTMDPESFHGELTVVDTHCDSLKCMLPEFTEARGSMWAYRGDVGLGSRSHLGHVDVPRLLEGGVSCQFFAVSAQRTRWPPHPLRTALLMVERFRRECRAEPRLVQAFKAADIREAKRRGGVAGVLSIEGCDVLEGRVEVLRVFHALGVRMVGLVHSLRNQLADGVADRRTGGGLSELGVEAVEELNRLGVLVDVSHLNDQGFWDVLDASRDPIVASHSNARSLCNHPRNLSDDMVVALAEKGGVVGVTFAPSFVSTGEATLEGVVDHIDRVAELGGVEHVGLGSDFDGIPTTPRGLEDASRFPAITAELLDRGYSEGEVAKIMGENHLRVFAQVVG